MPLLNVMTIDSAKCSLDMSHDKIAGKSCLEEPTHLYSPLPCDEGLTQIAALAQLVEHRTCNAGVVSSIPTGGTRKYAHVNHIVCI